MKKVIALLFTIMVCLVGTCMTASAQTREFTFHMNEKYLHGRDVNYGYFAKKADNERSAYVTVTSFVKTQAPEISMHVGSGTREVTTCSTWRSVAPKRRLDYHGDVSAKAGSKFNLCAEQFGKGTAVVSGRWTP